MAHIIDKKLLILELCSRSPYGVKVKISVEVKLKENDYIPKIKEYDYTVNEVHPSTGIIICGGFFDFNITDCKPRLYLRSLNSLSESELEEYNSLKEDLEASAIVPWKCFKFLNWCYMHHLDINGLIEMGLAIEVTEDNNPYKEK